MARLELLRNKHKNGLLYNLPLYGTSFFGAICGRGPITSLSSHDKTSNEAHAYLDNVVKISFGGLPARAIYELKKNL